MADAPSPPTPADIRARAAAFEEEAAAARKVIGRPPSNATTPDARLVARVCSALSCSRVTLARLLDYKDKGAALSRCNGENAVPLPEATRGKLREMLAEAKRGAREESDG